MRSARPQVLLEMEMGSAMLAAYTFENVDLCSIESVPK
jgi:hypothetical protein